MTLDPAKAEEYIKGLRKQFKEDPKKMETYERRMIAKHVEAESAATNIDNEVRQLRQQINQANARISSGEIQYADHRGKAAAYLEALIARKFEDELEDVIPSSEETPAAKGNGQDGPVRVAPSRKAKKKTRGRGKSASASTS